MASKARIAARESLARIGLLKAARIAVFPHREIPRFISRRWCMFQALEFTPVLQEVDFELWEEAQEFSRELEARAQQLLGALEHLQIGGGGNHLLLYFLTRFLRPQTAVETGVAAGRSTQAILAAMERNDRGRLYSSDLPYRRPEIVDSYDPFIGLLVDDHLKHRWELFVEGDRVNLPKIMSRIDSIDLFHYDSDKSARGRQFAMDTIKPKVHEESLIIMDDIDDNLFWRRWSRGRSSLVTRSRTKFLGISGPADLIDPVS